MRTWRFIVGGFISRYGIQIELGFWIKARHWLTLLMKATFGYAFFGISGAWGGWVSCGLARHGDRFVFKNNLFFPKHDC